MVKNKLLSIRLSLGYKNSKDFAEYLDISPATYSRYECNERQPNAEALLKILTKLNIKIDEVLFFE